MVLSVRVPPSVGVSTTCTATAKGVRGSLPCPVLTFCGHESPPRTSPTSSTVTTIAIAIAIAIAVYGARRSVELGRERERGRRAPISSKTSTKLHVRFVRMCGGGSVPGRVYI